MTEACGRILIFGGTSEGRTAAERLLAKGVPCTVSVATKYGEEVLKPHPLMQVHIGKMDSAAMAQLMQEESFSCVIDATHPHAQLVSKEVKKACQKTGLPYLRLRRESVPSVVQKEYFENQCVFVRDVVEAGAYLASVSGHILVTTGSKEIVRFANALGDPSRITARVLPSAESLRACTEAGLSGKQIFAMQGPFDTQMNCALLRHAGASWLLTKETGAAGGYPEKIEAAKQCGAGIVVIRTPAGETEGSRRPEKDSCTADDPDGAETTAEKTAGKTIEEGTENRILNPDQNLNLEQTIEAALSYAVTKETDSENRTLSLVGIGMGIPEAGTIEAQKAVAEAEILFGAKSVLENLLKTWEQAAGKTFVPIYESRSILQYLQEHPGIRSAAVLYSGDSGFYSGASSMLSLLAELKQSTDPTEPDRAQEFQVRAVCGISCVSWFAARAGIPWQDWKILSSHGRFCNVVGQVRRNRKCFLLLSGAEDLRRTGTLLADAQGRGMLGDLQLIYGYELSRPAEEICSCTARELTEIEKEGLYVLYIEHEDAEKTAVLPGLSDSAFTRGKAPMTSSEIRALSLCRLGLTAGAVVWDIGAGTGSVSIEAALACPEGMIWSVEYKEEALALLAENRSKFCLQNMEIVEGRAPQVLGKLPDPTHVFIGGSGGGIGEILDVVFSRNPEARVVVNCITSETLAALQEAMNRLQIRDVQRIQVSVNREEMLGRYHYLRASNPVFIISFTEGAPYSADDD